MIDFKLARVDPLAADTTLTFEDLEQLLTTHLLDEHATGLGPALTGGKPIPHALTALSIKFGLPIGFACC